MDTYTKLPSFRRIFTQDYPKEFKKLIDILSVSLNNGIEVLYEALNNSLTLRDNISCTVKDITLSVDSNGKPVTSANISLINNNTVDGVTVLSAINQVNPAVYPTGGVFISGAQNGNLYVINNITGLQPNTSYTIRLVAWQQ